MENESSILSNSNRKRGPFAGSLPATSSSLLASPSSVETNAGVEMPTTPEQLERMISTRVTAALASNGSGNVSMGQALQHHLLQAPHLALLPFTLPTPLSPPISVVIVRDIAKSEYRSTTSMSCDLLKSHKLIENGGDNKKRKEMILTIFGGEDLLSMLNGT